MVDGLVQPDMSSGDPVADWVARRQKVEMDADRRFGMGMAEARRDEGAQSPPCAAKRA
jgi:hypothetical protein